MTVVECVVSEAEAQARHGNYKRDALTLTFEDRRLGHGRRRSDSGLDFAISLPSGTLLKGGDCLVLPDEQTVVKVQEAFEAVYIVHPRTPREWAYYAYHAGNRHQLVMITDTELIFLQSPAVRSLLEQLQVAFDTGKRPFTAALVNVGHSY